VGADDRDPPKRRHQTATERDLNALARLRDERKNKDRKRAEDLDDDSASQGDAAEDFEAEVDTGVTQRILEDPDLNRLFEKIEAHKRRSIKELEAAKKNAADQIMAVAGEKPPQERFQKIERGLRIVHLVVVLITIPVITSAVMLGRYFYSRGSADAVAEPPDDILSCPPENMVLKVDVEGVQANVVGGVSARGAVEVDLEGSVRARRNGAIPARQQVIARVNVVQGDGRGYRRRQRHGYGGHLSRIAFVHFSFGRD